MIEYIAVGTTYNKIFTTNSAAGAAVAPSGAFGTDDIVIYKDNSATQRSSTSGWTVTSPFDSVTGQHLFSADLSDNTDAGFYALGHKYTVMLVPNETVDSQTVVSKIGEFIIGPVDANLIALLGTTWPTPATAGIPDVNVKNMNNVAATSITTINANQGTTQPVNFTGTAGSALVKGDAIDIGSVAQTGADVGEVAADVDELITTIGAAGAGLSAIPDSVTITEINADVDEIITTLGAAGAGLTAVAGIVLDAAQASHNGAGTIGHDIGVSASSAGDPWGTALPGAYAAGTAGFIVGTNLDTPVSEIGADTDELVTTVGVAGAGLTAITAKTDLITGTPSVAGDAMTLTAGERAALIAALGATLVPSVDLTAVSAPTIMDAFAAALAQGAGSWLKPGLTLTVNNLDGTVFRTFVLDNSVNPTQRI